MIKGNKGEWSEIYALFKILGDKEFFAGDADIKKIESVVYPIFKVIRSESGVNFEYELNGDLVLISGGQEQLKIPIEKFLEQSVKLLAKIKEIKKDKGSFAIPEIEEFMTSVHCNTLKAKSSSKTDIRIVIYDARLKNNAEMGFSIKSQVGNDATLFNASNSTNILFEIINFVPTSEEIGNINKIDTKQKVKDRIQVILSKGGELRFKEFKSTVFKNNLVLIDSLLSNIISELVRVFYSGKSSSIRDLTEVLKTLNPNNYDTSHSHSFYEYKVKRFLTDAALGMTAAKRWTGTFDATGGYLIVTEEGEVLCYHFFNKNDFENYLYSNTKLETPSTTKHDFGEVYEENGRFYIKLNLQIRFK